ncbi:MAG: arginine--tRNA ligase [Candidatus Lokiarchaeota archaeon]|nr:arginine--tRNA ligase [Candidatus Harpocratesius repetitus]
MNYAESIAEILADIIKNPDLPASKLVNFIESANKKVNADFTIICFKLQKILKLKGPEIAQNLAHEFTPSLLAKYPMIERIEAVGPYLNFHINKKIMAKDVIQEIFSDVHKYSLSKMFDNFKPQKIVVEYPSPNTNKPLHFGHVRNMLLGQALSRMNSKIGHFVYETNLLNDRGIHICKSMWAYQKFGKNRTPKTEGKKPDHFVGDYYVKFAIEENRLLKEVEEQLKELELEKKKTSEMQDFEKINKLQQEIDKTPYGQMQKELQQMLIDWENHVPEVRALWKKMNSWAEQGFQETFQLFNIKHTKTYYESQIYDKGKNLVLQGLKKGIFEQLSDGAIVARFSKKGLPKQKVLIRSDGTSLYITQDLYLAHQKYDDFSYDQSIYVIGNEQNMQMKTLFELLTKLGMPLNNIHYSYGMIRLTSGKMKSREGTVVDADDVVKELQELAKNEIKKRYPFLDLLEVNNRAFRIAMAALRFFILKYEYTRDFIFDPEQSISFEGETGPYILYAYARICSIFRKGLEKKIPVPYNPDENSVNQNYQVSSIDFNLLIHEEEKALISLLYQYPDKLKYAAETLRPHELMRYLLDIAQYFTRFYHVCPILSENSTLQAARLALCEAVRLILKDILNLFEIQELNEM